MRATLPLLVIPFLFICGVSKAAPGQTPPSAADLETADRIVLEEFKDLQNNAAVGKECIRCHSAEDEELQASVHGKAGLLQKLPPGALCLTCHEDNHALTDPKRIERFKLTTEHRHTNEVTCMVCHANPKLGAIFKFPPHVPSNFERTMHYRKALIGDRGAPLCADCHGSHAILRVEDPASTVNGIEKKVQVCAKCHAGSSPNFARSFDHIPVTFQAKPAEFSVLMVYRVLTLMTFAALALFMLFDLLSMFRSRLFKLEPVHREYPTKFVLRMDLSQRIQHFVMAFSMTLLFITAWPLLAPDTNAARAFTRLLGGAKSLAWTHRISGLVMIAIFIYHFWYLFQLYRKGHRKFPMWPVWKDLMDMINTGLYFIGVREERPKFLQYAWHEKFEYWAVCFGSTMMGISGLILMFPMLAGRHLPSWAISLSAAVHSSEALLAGVVVTIWHFYNVHFKPGVFPMNWSWLTGRMPKEHYEEEHGAHVEELRKRGEWQD